MTRLLPAFTLSATLLLCGVEAVHGQVGPPRRDLEALGRAAQARVVQADSLLSFRTRPVHNGRVDREEGVLRAAYRIEARVAPGLSPTAAAHAYLAQAAGRFGWPEDAADLALKTVQEGRYSTHLTFQQTFYGLPVHNRQVKVNLDREGQPSMVLSGYAPHLRRVRQFDPRPALSADEARTRAAALFTDEVATSSPELVVYPSKAPRLAWRILAWPQHEPAEWEVLLDAATGEVIHLFEQSTHRGEGERGKREEGGEKGVVDGGRPAMDSRSSPYFDPPAPETAGDDLSASTIRNRQSAIRNATDGSGLVFDPDPLTTAGMPYGTPYADAGDADVLELNNQRVLVPLREITQGGDGLYRLEGPYVQIVGDALGGAAYTPPAEASPDGFRYARSNDFFEAVMAYYHIDASQRYVQSLEVGRPIQAGPIQVNPQGSTDDNSKYLTDRNFIFFGTGGIDDAEDADVIWHEYAHALLEGSAANLRVTEEGQALHEGWADYWAASYSRRQIESGAVPARDWRRLFTWDGNETWCGRTLDHPGHYPDAMDYPSAECPAPGRIYQHGLLWATTLMEIYSDLGREVTDRLSLYSLAALSPADNLFEAAAHALIQADVDLYGGAHGSVLIDRLGARGFIDPSAYGPLLAHEPLPSTEQLGGTVAVEVKATVAVAEVDSVRLFHRTTGTAFEQLRLAGGSDTLPYTGELALPTSPDTVFYYVEAVDTQGRSTRLPADAPDEVFRFSVGPDHVPPQIVHDFMESASLAAWPVEVVADVQDPLGVDSVWVTYGIHAPDGTPQVEGAFGLNLEQGYYRAAFPIAKDQLQGGSSVRYALHARDRAAAANEAVQPADGPFSMQIVRTGTLLAYDFEGLGGNLSGTGVWARGEPSYGLHVARSGATVWATAPGAAYPDRAQQSSLDLPALDLDGLGSAYLVFWHWHDLEQSGGGADLWDGGNVKVSTDGGASWQVLGPPEGYSGTIESNYGNPLAGQAGFGGYSFGWQRVVMALPLVPDVRIRFDFGTDGPSTGGGNTEESAYNFAGWYLDDVSVVTDLPQDDAPPVASLLPSAVTARGEGLLPPPVVLEAEDSTGVASVWADYDLYTDAGVASGSVRLAMSVRDLSTFRGIFPLGGLQSGDRIEYRLRLRDVAGNQRSYPGPGSDPFRIEYRLMENTSLLTEARSSGSWKPAGDAWALDAGTAGGDRSSLVLAPFDLPANADDLSFLLEHRYSLGSELGGNVKISLDGGTTWSVLPAETGYSGAYEPGGLHPMQGEAVYQGSSDGFVQANFDLRAYAGKQVRLRIDFGNTRSLAEGESWAVQQARIFFSTVEDQFETPRTLALHPNFPEPFASTTTIGYTLPEPMPVRLEVFDLLGRRVAVLVDGEQAADTYTLTFDGSRLASGLYLLRLVAGGEQKVERMIVQR